VSRELRDRLELVAREREVKLSQVVRDALEGAVAPAKGEPDTAEAADVDELKRLVSKAARKGDVPAMRLLAQLQGAGVGGQGATAPKPGVPSAANARLGAEADPDEQAEEVAAGEFGSLIDEVGQRRRAHGS